MDNAVQANQFAATCADEHKDQVYNVAYNARTTLKRHSQADIGKAAELGG